jgi:hypothetical protein
LDHLEIAMQPHQVPDVTIMLNFCHGSTRDKRLAHTPQTLAFAIH